MLYVTGRTRILLEVVMYETDVHGLKTRSDHKTFLGDVKDE